MRRRCGWEGHRYTRGGPRRSGVSLAGDEEFVGSRGVRDQPGAIPALGSAPGGRGGGLGTGRRRGGGVAAGLRAEAEFLRSGRRHRTGGCGATAAFRASRGGLRRDYLDERGGLLRRSEHPDAGAIDPRPQGELLQVHERDAAGDGGCVGALGAGLSLRAEWARERGWLRAGSRLRLRDAGRRRQRGGGTA